VSQAWYPIKGLHYVLEALPEVIKRFPDTHLYIAGSDITRSNSLKAKVKAGLGSYEEYIRRLIKKLDLSKCITFTGVLNEEAMCERFIKSHVFVSPSSIENSPNSLGEAMLLGVPSISTDVGGVKDLLTHNVDGVIYQHDAPYMLAYYICLLFGDDELTERFSINAQKHAEITHNREKNTETVLEKYSTIFKQ